MSAITSPFTTTGTLSLTKRPYDAVMTVNLYGSQTGLSFAFEGSVDGTNGWKALQVTDLVSGAQVSGTISPADLASYAWRVHCDNMQVRMNVSAISGGTGNVNWAASPGAPGAPAVTSLSNPTAASWSSVPGSITSASATGGIGYATGAGGAVTQATNSATGVTINTPTGQITTVALTTAAAAEERFTVTCSSVAATDCISLGTTYNGNGTPAVSVVHVAAGAFDVVITNLHASAALNAAMVINYAVIKGVAA